MEFGTLLRDYVQQGGNDLGEFLVGTAAREDISPLQGKGIGNFPGVMAGVGGKLPRLFEFLDMKGSSLKRMIAAGRMDKAEAIERCLQKLGIVEGSAEDAMFWHLARGDKSIPAIMTVVEDAQAAMGKKDANKQALAREAALKLFERSGFTLEKFAKHSQFAGMIKEITRNEGYAFQPARAVEFSKVIGMGNPRLQELIADMLLGIEKRRSEAELANMMQRDDEGLPQWSFGQVLRRVRLQRRQTQEEFAEAFTKAIQGIMPGEEVGKSMVEKWEGDKVKTQTRKMASALGSFLGFPRMFHGYVPCADLTQPAHEQMTGDTLMRAIRSKALNFSGYVRMRMRERGLTQEGFADEVATLSQPLNPSAVGKWLRGEPANVDQAALLADYENLTELADRRDFMAFARTGKLERSKPDILVKQLLGGELPLPDFVMRLRNEEGMSPEQFDAHVGLGKGTTRNLEDGRELRTDAAQRFTAYMRPQINPDLLAQFNERLIAPHRKPLDQRVKSQVWMERIREGNLFFKDYLRTKLLETGMSRAQFADHLSSPSGTVGASAIANWMKGSHVLAAHAALLADAEGLKDADDRRDFIAFARTGLLMRADAKAMLEKVATGEMRVAELVQQLRSQEGMSREQFDVYCDMPLGTTQKTEAGHALDAVSADKIAIRVVGLDTDERLRLREHLCTESSVAPSSQGFDAEGYRELMDRVVESCPASNLQNLRRATASARYEHFDSAEEMCWRSMVADAMAGAAHTRHASIVQDWNALHDVLFTRVDPRLLADRSFTNHIESVMTQIGQRDDGGVARRWLTAMIVRKMHDEKLPEKQRELLVENSALLNMRFIANTIRHYAGAASLVDDTMLWDRNSDALKDIIRKNKLKMLVPSSKTKCNTCDK